ncbi:MAG: AraC family transcriptional regulator [Planctomycetes bacterium]|nr:AraC family transcriptional regulator [Planctomycetota bacterium]
MELDHRVETIPAFDLHGLQIRTSNDRAMETIGPLWGRVYSGDVAGMAVGQVRLYAAYSNYESDHNGEYDYLIGAPVDADADVPDGMVHLRVPKQRYAVITAQGEMPGALVETWMQIWEAGLPRAFATDFEIHDPANPGEVEIWLSLAEDK